MSPLFPLLALIARADAYGYELKRVVETDFAPYWKLDFAQLYRSLAKLRAQGLVRVRAIGREGGPERKQYSITARGRDVLREWIREPAAEQNEFWVKLRLATSLGYSTESLVHAERVRMEQERETQTARTQSPKKRFAVSAHAAEMPLRIAGSDDLLLKRLAEESNALVQVNGSTMGLVALASNQVDLAGVHLREPGTSEYNISFVQHLAAEQDVLLVNLAVREYGLLVAPGNPKRIRVVRDLERGVRLINRTQGSGARLWLQRHIRASHIDPTTLHGWMDGVITYAAVARAILEDTADVGPGLRVTAETFGLEFIPLGEERFDIAVSRPMYESRRGVQVQEILASKPFRTYARTLSGYDLSRSGNVIAEIKFGTRRRI
jgi:molybdate-binding protein/DNA-binding PadR family transcriptional regulator